MSWGVVREAVSTSFATRVEMSWGVVREAGSTSFATRLETQMLRGDIDIIDFARPTGCTGIPPEDPGHSTVDGGGAFRHCWATLSSFEATRWRYTIPDGRDTADKAASRWQCYLVEAKMIDGDAVDLRLTQGISGSPLFIATRTSVATIDSKVR